jgi:hypothetical protein
MKRVLLAVVLGVVFLGACGDDGGSGDESKAVDKVKASLVDDSEGFAMEEKDADCIAKEVVKTFGVDRTNEIDWEADEPAFEGDEAKKAAGAFDACTDMSEFLTTTLVTNEDISEPSADCLGKTITDEDALAYLEWAFDSEADGDDPVLTKIDDALQECLTADEYEAFNA